jgi:agmatine/peptidylarginine deiminase
MWGRTGALGVTVAVLGLFALGMSGCDAESAGEKTAVLAPEGFEIPVSAAEGEILPAWQTSAERLGAKADQLDPRGTYPGIYGITGAPSGARAIAEFEPTDGVLIAWTGAMTGFFVDLIRDVSGATEIYLLTPDIGTSATLRDYFADQGVDTDRLHFLEYAHDAFWTRDFGPIAIELGDGSAAFVDARYYADRRRDDAVPTLLADYVDVPVYRPNVSTEGGNFMTNGEGLCVVTEWLLQENTNLSETELITAQRDTFGCAQTIVLQRMAGEGTGHVDMYAKFTARDTVLVGTYNPIADPMNAAILDENAARLADITLADGTPMRVVRIPMPTISGDVYRSYTNSLIANGVVFMPTYDTDRYLEDDAEAAYLSALPEGYALVKIDASEVIEWGGAVHCTTMSFNVGELTETSPTNTPTEEPILDTPPEPEPTTQGDTIEQTPMLPIEDQKQAVDTIEVSGTDYPGLVSGAVDLSLTLSHSYIGDLAIYLEHDGRWAELHRFGGGGAQDIDKAWSIKGFEGTPLAGKWRLVIEDHADQDKGTFEHWSLLLH